MKSAHNLSPRIFSASLCLFVCVFSLNACSRSHQDKPMMPIPEVLTISVSEQRLELSTDLPGRTSACLIAEVRPQVSGIIQKRLFEEGAAVREGDILYQIDPAQFQAAYSSANASLARAQANLPAIKSRYERYRDLLGSKAVSQQDVDDATSAYNQAQAEVTYWKAAVETARINLGYTQVTASITGRIGKSSVTQGALVTANQPAPLATIQKLDPMYVDVPQSTAELLRLKRRMEGGILNPDKINQKKVKLILEDGSTYPLQGRLQFRDVTVDPSAGTVVLRADFPNPQNILLPGMFVRAVVMEGVNDKAILVPQQAVSRDPKGTPFVLLVNRQGKVEQRQLTLDRAIGNQWLIASGLAPGDQLVIEGVQKAKPGIPVKVVRSETDKAITGKEPAMAAGQSASSH